MAVPPSYADLGKAARDLFNKGYNYGTYKLDVTQKSASGFKVKVSGKNSHADNKVDGGLEATTELKEHGLKFVLKGSSGNTVGTDITLENQLAKGLKLELNTTFEPHTGKKTGKVKSAYKKEGLNANCDVDLAGPVIHGAGVLGYKGCLFGYQMAFDAAKSALTKNNLSFGYLGPDFTANLAVDGGNQFNGSYHHKVSCCLEAGAIISWNATSNAGVLSLGTSYQLDKDGKIRAKISNNMQIGLSYERKLRPGVTLTLSSLLEGKSFNAGGHKIGLGLEMEH